MSESYKEWPEYVRAEAQYIEFSATKHGKRLAEASRYGLYRKDRFSHEDYWKLLGPDVNNLRHMAYTAQLAAYFERKQSVPSPTAVLERRLKGAFGHDNAEAITGDLNYIDKTDEDFVTEQEAFLEHITEFYSSETAQQEMTDIAKTIIFDENSVEGKNFSMVEHAGYLQACLKAWAAVNYGKAKDFSEDDKYALMGITASVLGSTLDKTLDFYETNTYPEFTQFINNRKRMIIEAFNNMPSQAFDIFGQRQTERLDKFNQAKTRWAVHFNEIVISKEGA